MANSNDRGARVKALSARQGLWFVVVLAVVVRLGLFYAAFDEPQRFLMPDSAGYLDLASQASQVYRLPPADGTDIAQSLNRTPLYPIFLHAVQAVSGGDLRALALGQILVSVLTVLLVWRLGLRLFGPGPALSAALLLALDPASAIYSNLLISETLFTFGMVLSALLLARALDQRRASGAAGFGVALGLATLVRPASLYFPVFALPLTLLGTRGRGWWWRGAALLIAGFLVIAVAWLWRNQQVSGEVMFTSMEAGNLNYRATWAVADQRGITFEEALVVVDAMHLPQVPGRHVLKQFNGIQKKESVRLMLENPIGLAKSSLRGFVWYLFGPGRAGLAQLIGFDSGAVAAQAAFTFGFAFILLIYATGLWGCRLLLREGNRQPLCFLFVFILYFSIVSAAPEAYVRFRVPVMPFFCLLAGAGFSGILAQFRASRAKAHTNPVFGNP